jgi:hypothetical protein
MAFGIVPGMKLARRCGRSIPQTFYDCGRFPNMFDSNASEAKFWLS